MTASRPLPQRSAQKPLIQIPTLAAALRGATVIRFGTMLLNPTPPHKLCDEHGHPYFLWDVDMTLEQFRAQLTDPDPDVRAHALGKLMRQAKPDDTLSLVSLEAIRADWDGLQRYLGKRREFWNWLLPELEQRAG